MLDMIVSRARAVSVPLPIVPPDFIPFSQFIANIIQVILLVAGILAVVFLVYAGIQYIASGGDATKSAAARTGIINAVIGIIIILLAFSINIWVQNVIIQGQP